MQSLRNDEKGMTLIEIMVVLLLSAIVLIIAGNILLSSIGFFQKTGDANNDQQALHTLTDHVRSELIYASDIVVDTSAPSGDDWHRIAVDEFGHLRIDEKAVVNEGFYNQRLLQLEARNDVDLNRIDLRFAIMDESDNRLYESESSLTLVNKTTIDSSQAGSLTPYTNISDTSGYAIYYRKGIFIVRDDPNDPDIPDEPGLDESGTVKDQIKCKDEQITKPGEQGDNKGIWQPNKTYTEGNYVQYPDANGAWYILTITSDSTSIAPNLSWEWKCLNAVFDPHSYYEYGDIVIYNEKYYQVINQTGSLAFDPTISSIWKGPKDNVHDLKLETAILPSYTTCPIKQQCSGTVADEVFELNESNNKGTWYANMPNIKKGDFVQHLGDHDQGIMYWYRALGDYLVGYSPGVSDVNKGSMWKRIAPVDKGGNGDAAKFELSSSYYKGDIVYYPANGKYYKLTPERIGTMSIIWMVDPVTDRQASLYWTEVAKPSNVCVTTK